MAVKRLLPVALLALALTVPSAGATAGNPFAGRRIGVTTTTDAGNPTYTSWMESTGTNQTLFARTGLRSKARYFGTWSGSGDDLTRRIASYVENAQDGDPEVVVPITFFRIWPRGEGDRRALSQADRTAYLQWYAAAARGIGEARVAVVLEPDMPLTLSRHGTKDTKMRLALVNYAARTLSKLPHASVYIDAGSADWMPEDKNFKVITDMLIGAGVRYARGFALGATHYDSLAANVTYARSVAIALTRRGVAGKKAVIDTADNGRPFTYAQYAAMLRKHTRRNHFDNADVCVNRSSTACVTLGVPPTSDVARKGLPLTTKQRGYAASYVDAYLWFGRPWLRMQADPYCKDRALQIARTTPWQGPAMPQLSAATVRSQQSRCFARP